MKLDIVNIEGDKTGRSIDLPDDIFGIEPNEHAVYLAVKQYLANQRQGTHKSKERNEIAGSTRKIKRQKGTGTARAGSIKSGIFRGGGRMFGPKPRNYRIKLNKKVARLARKSALTSKAQSGSIVVVENIKMDDPKTKNYVNFLNNLELGGKKSLLVTEAHNENVYLSSRNIQKARVMRAQDLSTYDVMNSGTLIIFEGAVDKIKATFGN
ncbi:MAG: 50S ribosomal protein L4 [Bacteroidota bacterium]